MTRKNPVISNTKTEQNSRSKENINSVSSGRVVSIKNGIAFVQTCGFSIMYGQLTYRRDGMVLTNMHDKHKVVYRSMMSGKSIYVGRAAYHCITALLNNSAIDLTNKETIAENIVNLSLDNQAGIPQHKTMLMKHMLSHKFPVDQIYGPFQEHMASINSKIGDIIKWEPNIEIDCRFMNELPVVKRYLEWFSSDIAWCLATNDSRPANFPHQVQSNQDFWVMVDASINKMTTCGYKCVPQDEKSGMGMFEHSTRGSIGKLTYDHNGVLIPFTNKQINLACLDEKRLIGIKQSCLTDGFPIDNQFFHYSKELKKYTQHSIINEDFINLHNNLDSYLWNNFQRHPDYKRSISFVFIEHLHDLPVNENTLKFAQHFKSLLQNRMYDLHDRKDRREVFHAMLIAGIENIDRDLVKKIRYLSNDFKLQFTNIFLEDVASLIKKLSLNS